MIGNQNISKHMYHPFNPISPLQFNNQFIGINCKLNNNHQYNTCDYILPSINRFIPLPMRGLSSSSSYPILPSLRIGLISFPNLLPIERSMTNNTMDQGMLMDLRAMISLSKISCSSTNPNLQISQLQQKINDTSKRMRDETISDDDSNDNKAVNVNKIRRSSINSKLRLQVDEDDESEPIGKVELKRTKEEEEEAKNQGESLDKLDENLSNGNKVNRLDVLCALVNSSELNADGNDDEKEDETLSKHHELQKEDDDADFDDEQEKMESKCVRYVNKDLWSLEEDEMLLEKQAQFGADWYEISKFFEGRKLADIKKRFKAILLAARKEWSQHDDELLMKIYERENGVWDNIAKYFGNRTERAVKSRYRTLLVNLSDLRPSLGAPNQIFFYRRYPHLRKSKPNKKNNNS